ncbi:hypothetical protein ACP70R_050372 [Stipagrostis hirtigluma subsp. patula]
MDRRASSSAAAASIATLAAAAAAGEGADGALPAPGKVENNAPVNLAAVPVSVAGASSSSSSSSAARGVAVAAGRGGGGPSCQAERCGADLSEAKRYNRRHKVCEAHSKAPVVLVAGLRQRFCQQCSR